MVESHTHFHRQPFWFEVRVVVHHRNISFKCDAMSVVIYSEMYWNGGDLSDIGFWLTVRIAQR